MIFITRSEINQMKKNIIDEELGITEFDTFEEAHCYEDWEIIEDITKEEEQLPILSLRGEESYAPTSYGGNLDDSDIRGTEALGCLYACVRWCVGVMLMMMMMA